MDKSLFLKQAISNHLEKYLKIASKVKLPEWDFTLMEVHDGDVILTDETKTTGNIVFSMNAEILIQDPASKVSTKNKVRFVGVADTREFRGGIDENGKPLMLPEVIFIDIQSIQLV